MQKPPTKKANDGKEPKKKRHKGRFAGRHRWSLDDAVIRERTAFGRTICALECGDLVNHGCHPETTPLLLWNDNKTAPLELLQRSHQQHQKTITHPDLAEDKGVCSRLQVMDERWYMKQNEAVSTDIEKTRRMRGVARQTAVFGVSTLYIPPGIETAMKSIFNGSAAAPTAATQTKKYIFGSDHAMPPKTGKKMKIEQKVILRGQAGSRVLQSRANTILRKLRAADANGAFVVRDFMVELRRMARARLVYAEFLPIATTTTIQNQTTWDRNAFGLCLCFVLDRRGRYFGQFRFTRCELKPVVLEREKTSFGERLWLCARVPKTSVIKYSQHACECSL